MRELNSTEIQTISGGNPYLFLAGLALWNLNLEYKIKAINDLLIPVSILTLAQEEQLKELPGYFN